MSGETLHKPMSLYKGLAKRDHVEFRYSAAAAEVAIWAQQSFLAVPDVGWRA